MINSLNLMLGADPTLYHTLAVIKLVIVALMGVCALAIIVLVLCQKGNSGGGSNAITGMQETYYSQNKGKTVEGRLKAWTAGIAIAMAVMTIVYFILASIVSGNV